MRIVDPHEQHRRRLVERRPAPCPPTRQRQAFELFEQLQDIGQVADTMGLQRHAVSVFVSRERIQALGRA